MINPFSFYLRGAVIAGLAILAAGCIKPSGNYHFISGSYDDVYRSEYVYAVAENDVKTTIIGNPFSAPKEVTEKAVLAAMNKVNKGHRSNFTNRPVSNKRNYHVMMVFDPDRRRGELCNPGVTDSTSASRNPVSLGLVFCSGNRLVFAGAANGENISGPDDPKFDRMVQRLVWYFTPRYGLGDEEPE